ncbi:hypothetical protein EOD23_10025 [Mesorhizobium sp. USDA-HM6]|nr:hypothetical protein EOD23_10025 [Mesorhizobium sp. USDA-HM6]
MAIANPGDTESDGLDWAAQAQARRDSLKKGGRFAAVTPPAITLLLGTSLNSVRAFLPTPTGPFHGRRR